MSKGKNRKPRKLIRREHKPPAHQRIIAGLQEMRGGKKLINQQTLTDLLGRAPQTDEELREFDKRNPFRP